MGKRSYSCSSLPNLSVYMPVRSDCSDDEAPRKRMYAPIKNAELPVELLYERICNDLLLIHLHDDSHFIAVYKALFSKRVVGIVEGEHLDYFALRRHFLKLRRLLRERSKKVEYGPMLSESADGSDYIASALSITSDEEQLVYKDVLQIQRLETRAGERRKVVRWERNVTVKVL